MAKKSETEAPPTSGMALEKAINSTKAIKALNKHYSGQVLHLASKTRAIDAKRWPSGIYQIDSAIGGGVPPGRIMEIFGDTSNGKTALAMQFVAQAQNMCAREMVDLRFHTVKDPRLAVCAWICTENDWAPDWAEARGIDLDRLLFGSPASGAEALDTILASVEQGLVDMLVFDSIAFATPTLELDNLVDANHPGSQARLMGSYMRKLTSTLSGLYKRRLDGENVRYPAILATNQRRFKIGVMFGNPETRPGGEAPKFGSSITVRVGSAKSDKKNNVKLRFKVRKNKTFRPFREAEWTLRMSDEGAYLRGEFEDFKRLYLDAADLGILEYRGSKPWTVTLPKKDAEPNEDGVVEVEVIEFARRKGDARDALHPSTELYHRIRRELLKSEGVRLDG